MSQNDYEDPPDTADYQQDDVEGQEENSEVEDLEGQAEGEAEEGADSQEIAEGMLPSITLPVIVALGRSYMSIKEILKLQSGQILELNKNPNEPVDLVVNGKVVARGELVDVEGRLAVRLIKIVE